MQTLWAAWDDQTKSQVEEFRRSYPLKRQAYIKGSLRMTRIGDEHSLLTILAFSPPPIIGGPVININLFRTAVDTLPYRARLQEQRIIDIIDQAETSCEEQLTIERRRLYNPFYWIVELLTFILRIPFLIIKTSGFHLEKFEDQFWGRLFKLLELVALVCFLLWLGASRPEIKEVFFNYLHLGKAAEAIDKPVDKQPAPRETPTKAAH